MATGHGNVEHLDASPELTSGDTAFHGTITLHLTAKEAEALSWGLRTLRDLSRPRCKHFSLSGVRGSARYYTAIFKKLSTLRGPR